MAFFFFFLVTLHIIPDRKKGGKEKIASLSSASGKKEDSGKQAR